MDQESIVADIEKRAFAARVTINAVCKQAGVAASTFSRWKRSERNPEPTSATLDSIGRIYRALAHFEAQSRRRTRRAA